jgi:hypothetical protein
VLIRCLGFFFASFLVFLSLPLLVFRCVLSKLCKVGETIAVLGRERRALHSCQLRSRAPVGEFAFEQAIAAYEDLIDTTHAGREL